MTDSTTRQRHRRTVIEGRMTAAGDETVTVFLIGMRLNRLHRIDKWWPVFMAMPRMIKHLAKNPELGMLSFDMWFGRTTLLMSYWKSPEHLQAFASDTSAPHVGPWRDFNRAIGSSGVVGIWHETYVVTAAQREVIYVNMPPFGLGKALGVEPVGRGTATAKQRLNRHADRADHSGGVCPARHDGGA